MAELTAVDLGVIAVREALRRAFGEIPEEGKPGEKIQRDSSVGPVKLRPGLPQVRCQVRFRDPDRVHRTPEIGDSG